MARFGWIVLGLVGVVAGAETTLAQDIRSGGITIAAPWARATPGGAKVGAAFLEIRSEPGADDKLVAAKSPAAGTVEIHDHIRDGSVMKMRRIEAIAVAGGKTAALKPGGQHLMLMDLKGDLREGETVEVTLVFEKAGEIKVPVPIGKVGAMSGPGMPAVGNGSGSGSGAGSGSGSGPGR